MGTLRSLFVGCIALVGLVHGVMFDWMYPADQNRATINPTAIHNWFIVNYVDEDPSAGIMDYTGGSASYNGHTGTDVTITDFMLMDKGYPVYAGAAGTVVFIVNDQEDRHTASTAGGQENNVIVSHSDGTRSWYLHFRKESIVVNVGDAIVAGQMLGMTGSSGQSTWPHCHFETGQIVAGNWVPRDPWNGAENANPSLWNSQLTYISGLPVTVHRLAVVPRDLNNDGFTQDEIANGVESPLVFGNAEPFLAVLIIVSAPQGETLQFQILNPTGGLFYSFGAGATVNNPVRVGYYNYYTSAWAGLNPTPGTYAAVIKNQAGTVVYQQSFAVVQGNTRFAPRFTPIGGRSIRVDLSFCAAVDDALQVSLSPEVSSTAVTYRVVSAPPALGVTLTPAGSSVTVHLNPQSVMASSATGDQFSVEATDSAGGTASYYYHIVYYGTKSVNCTSGSSATTQASVSGLGMAVVVAGSLLVMLVTGYAFN